MLQNSEAFSLVKNIVSRRSHSGTEVLSGVENCVDQVVEKTLPFHIEETFLPH